VRSCRRHSAGPWPTTRRSARCCGAAGEICWRSSTAFAEPSSWASARWCDAGTAVRDLRSESGAAYLRDRLETRQSARRLARDLVPLTALARSIRRALPQRDLPVLDAYLVDRTRVAEFVALVAELGDLLDGVELVCTGPCPPYSFADGGVIRSTA